MSANTTTNNNIKSLEKITKLKYRDDLKVFAKNKQKLKFIRESENENCASRC